MEITKLPDRQQPSRRTSPPIKVWLLPKEKATIGKMASLHSMSASGFLRAVGLGYPIRCTVDQDAIIQLSKINGDLGRLGGLLKMWLSNEERAINMDRITLLVTKIEELRDELAQKASRLK